MIFALITVPVLIAQQSLPKSLDATGQVAGYLVPQAPSFRLKQGTAPRIDSLDATGRAINLAMFAKGPIVLFFIDRDCPYTRVSKSYYDQIQFVYRTQATVIGVIDANKDDAGEWVEAAVPKFRLALDPDLKIAKAYGAVNSMHTVLISRDLKVIASWRGFSASVLKDLSAQLSKQEGVHQKPILRFGSAPSALTCGNPLTPQDKKG